MNSIVSCCKCCFKMYIPSDVIIIEERPLAEGGPIIHNYGPDVLCTDCKAAAFAEESYEDMFEDKWVKPCKFEKYIE